MKMLSTRVRAANFLAARSIQHGACSVPVLFLSSKPSPGALPIPPSPGLATNARPIDARDARAARRRSLRDNSDSHPSDPVPAPPSRASSSHPPPSSAPSTSPAAAAAAAAATAEACPPLPPLAADSTQPPRPSDAPPCPDSSDNPSAPAPPDPDDRSALVGKLALLGVAVLWGSYSPALKLVFSFPDPPDASLVTLAKGAVSATSLLAASALFGRGGEERAEGAGEPGGERCSEEGEKGGLLCEPEGAVNSNPMQRALSTTLRPLPLAGLELGLWYFGGSASQAMGLSQTSSLRAGFLIQLISLIVPVLAFLQGETVSARTWLCCLCALAGALMISLEKTVGAAGAGLVEAASGGSVSGDLLVVAACFFYAMATVRLSRYAKRFAPTVLASARHSALLLFSAMWFLFLRCDLLASDGLSALAASAGTLSWPVLASLAYIGIVPGAMAAVLQALGQRLVPTAQAQVIYSTTSLWSAVLTMLVLRDETLGPIGWAGGAVIAAAGLVAGGGSTHGDKKGAKA